MWRGKQARVVAALNPSHASCSSPPQVNPNGSLEPPRAQEGFDCLRAARLLAAWARRAELGCAQTLAHRPRAACLFIHHKRPMRSSPHATLVSLQERAAWRTGPATPVEQQHLSTRAAGCHPTAATIAPLQEVVAGAGGDDDSPLSMTRPNPFGRPKQTPHFMNWLQGQAMMMSPRDAYASSSSRKSCAKANNAALQVKQLSSAICVRRQPQIKTGTEGEQRVAALQAQTSCSCNGLTLPMTIHSPLSVHRGTRLTCRRGVGAAALVWAGELEAAQPIGQPASSRRRQHRARMAPSQLTCLQCCRPARPVWIAGRGAKRISTQARAPLAAAAFRPLCKPPRRPPLGPCP